MKPITQQEIIDYVEANIQVLKLTSDAIHTNLLSTVQSFSKNRTC